MGFKTTMAAAVCIGTAAAMTPLAAFAAYTAADAGHMVKVLTTQEKPTAADDADGNKAVNAIDLSLAKQEILAGASTGESKEATIPADADHVKLIGRTMEKDGVRWLVQSGSAAEFTVTGTEASVTIAGDGCVKSEEKYRPRYAVYLDGELLADVVMGEAEQTVELFAGKTNRTATVKVIHLSEANNGAVGVKAINVVSAAANPVRPTPKKDLSIEFIGDSITCAYGVEADSQYTGFATGTENFSLSYAYLTAQLLDADYSAVSYSGHGIISGYTTGDTPQADMLVPPVYELVGKPADYAVAWDFAANPSDVIVVNLGTNDDSYATKDLEKRGAEYQAGYEDFLKQIRANNPDAVIICTLGIMGCEELYPYIEQAVEAVGDEKISCYQSPTQKAADGYGADWHPSPKTQEMNAYLLADKICTAIGRESNKIGIDLAQDGEYGAEIDKESGANAWPYFSEWDKSLNINVMSAGTAPDSMYGYVRNISLLAGGYELSFGANPPADFTLAYAVRSMTDPEKIYCTGELKGNGENQTVLKPFTMEAADDKCEIVFFFGELATGNLTFRDVTLFKRS